MYACVHIGVHCWQDGVSLRGSNTDFFLVEVQPAHPDLLFLKICVQQVHWIRIYFSVKSEQSRSTSFSSLRVEFLFVSPIAVWVGQFWFFFRVEPAQPELFFSKFELSRWLKNSNSFCVSNPSTAGLSTCFVHHLGLSWSKSIFFRPKLMLRQLNPNIFPPKFGLNQLNSISFCYQVGVEPAWTDSESMPNSENFLQDGICSEATVTVTIMIGHHH